MKQYLRFKHCVSEIVKHSKTKHISEAVYQTTWFKLLYSQLDSCYYL